MSNEVYRLEILMEGKSWVVYGMEENLRMAYDEIRAAKSEITGMPLKVVEIIGFTNSFDRTDERMLVEVETVVAMDLVKVGIGL